ncbi:MAG: NUDIX domain-containing protein [Candidatus Krumholzibacteriia bacterium]
MSHHPSVAADHAATQCRHPALTVDAVVLRSRPPAPGRAEFELLLVLRGRDPYRGCWAFPGGFVDYGEEPGAAVRREVEEEAGLTGLPLRQHRTYGDPRRDPRGHTVTIVYVAELGADADRQAPRAGDDADRVAWFPLDALPELAFDHRAILDDVLELRG